MRFDQSPALFTKCNGLIAAAALALLSGVAEANRGMIALGAMCAAMVALAFWRSRNLLAGFGAERRHYPRCLEGEELDVNLRVWNDGRRPALMLELADRFEPATRSRVAALAPEPLAGGEELELEYRRACSKRRGVYVIGPLELRAADPLGLFPQARELETFTELRVAPRGARLEKFDVLGRGAHDAIGAETARRRGPGEEFLELREYRPGDPPRLIHWPSAARTGRLVVKEFNINVTTEASIFVDFTRLAHTGVGDVTSAELAIKAATTVIDAVIRQQHHAALFLIGSRVERLPAGGGGAQFNLALDRLTVVRVQGESDFAGAVADRLIHIRRGATAVFIVAVTRIDVARMETIIRHLALDRVKPIAILIDDRGFTKIWPEQELQHADAPSMRDLARRFQMAGADVYALAKGDDLRARLEANEKTRG